MKVFLCNLSHVILASIFCVSIAAPSSFANARTIDVNEDPAARAEFFSANFVIEEIKAVEAKSIDGTRFSFNPDARVVSRPASLPTNTDPQTYIRQIMSFTVPATDWTWLCQLDFDVTWVTGNAPSIDKPSSRSLSDMSVFRGRI